MSEAGLVLVGAGGLARETAEAAAAAGLRVRGFADDDPRTHGSMRGGLPVLGSIASVASRDERLVLCPGRGTVRLALAERLAGLGVDASRYATVVHPRAVVCGSATVLEGSILLAGVVLTADVTVGRHVVVMPNAVLTHDVRLEDGATICAGAGLAGTVRVERGAYVGAGAQVRENLVVGTGATLGMGSVLVRDLPPGEVWMGNPARRAAATTKGERP